MSSVRFSRLQPTRQAELALVAVTLLAASGWWFSHEALREMPPFVFLGSRFLLAGLLLAGLEPRALRALPRPDWLRALGVGLWFAAGMLVWILALKHSPQLGVGAFLNSTSVVLVPLLGWLLWRQRIGLSGWACAGLAGLGVLALTGGQVQWHGQGRYLLAACLFAVYFNLNSRAVQHLGALPLTAVVLTLTGIAGLLMAGLTGEPWRWPGLWTVLMLAASVLLATCLRFWLQTHAQQQLSASQAALLLTLEPVWTAALGLTLLGEHLSRLQLSGCGLIFLALVLSRLWPVPRT